MLRQLIGLLVQLTIGELLVSANQRDALGIDVASSLEEFVQTPRSNWMEVISAIRNVDFRGSNQFAIHRARCRPGRNACHGFPRSPLSRQAITRLAIPNARTASLDEGYASSSPFTGFQPTDGGQTRVQNQVK